MIRAWGAAAKQDVWANWLADLFCGQEVVGKLDLPAWVDRHIALAETLAAGSESDGTGTLWQENAGRALTKIVTELRSEAPYGTDMNARDYNDLFGAIIAVVCSYKGMTASGGAAGVGRAVNEAVVISFMGVFAFNYAFTQTLLATNPELQTIR